MVAFRDYLRADARAREGYVRLRRELAEKHADDVRAYVDGKAEFIRKASRLAGP